MNFTAPVACTWCTIEAPPWASGLHRSGPYYEGLGKDARTSSQSNSDYFWHQNFLRVIHQWMQQKKTGVMKTLMGRREGELNSSQQIMLPREPFIPLSDEGSI